MSARRKSKKKGARRVKSESASRDREKPALGKGAATDPPALRVAKALWKNGRYDEALKQFGLAVRQDRTNIRALIDASRAFGARYQIAKSDAFLQRALRLGPRRHDVQFLVGESYRMMGQYLEAEACFRRACRLAEFAPPSPIEPQAQLELATIFERKHRIDEANDLIDRVLRAQPRSASAMVLKARLERRRGETAAAEAILRRVISGPSIKPVLVAEAWGELAQLLDEQSAYDSAWEAILECKQVLLPRSEAEQRAAKVVLARFGRMVETITQHDFDRWHTRPVDLPTDRLALLTGFPRSGTTLLEQVLDGHPQLVSSEEQDVLSAEIFPNLGRDRSHEVAVQEVLDRLSTDQIQDERARYLHYMDELRREPIGDRIHLDKNPAMTLMVPVVVRLFPEVKMLVALRDPRDVIVSCFVRFLPLNPVSVCYLTLERAVERYALDMKGWLKFREMLHAGWLEVRYEDVVADLPRQARRAIEFLELPWDDSVLRYRERTQDKQVLSPTYEAVARPIYTKAIGRWRNYEQYLEGVLPILEPLLRNLGYS